MRAATAAAKRPSERSIRRGWSDVAMVGLGAAILGVAALPVDQYRVPAWERSIFRAINDSTVLPFLVVWSAMQLGNLVAVPVLAGVAAACRKWRLAAGLLLGGVAAYLMAKAVKTMVPRGRPAAMLSDVQIRGDAAAGRGFVSGHAAIVTVIAVLAWPYLGRRARVGVVGCAVAVCWARVYVSAHLPLDVLGGAALGLAIAGLVRLLLGRPG